MSAEHDHDGSAFADCCPAGWRPASGEPGLSGRRAIANSEVPVPSQPRTAGPSSQAKAARASQGTGQGGSVEIAAVNPRRPTRRHALAARALPSQQSAPAIGPTRRSGVELEPRAANASRRLSAR